MIRVFYLSVDPEDEKPLIYKTSAFGPAKGDVRQGTFGVELAVGGVVCTYGEPDTEGPHETQNLVPWHRVLEIEYS